MKILTTPLNKNDIATLKAGEEVLLSGTIFTARDQAHKRLVETLRGGRRLPCTLKGSVIYYCGPTATPKGKVIGSCGPTTSRRMDSFTPSLLDAGLSAMIGKGSRSPEVVSSIKKNRAVYFLAPAGCGALVSKYVTRNTLIAYPELGPEAVRALEVSRMPLIVAIDSRGKSVYD